MNDHYAILLAGGKGTRMKSPEMDKLLAPLHNTNAFRLSYKAFLETEKINNAIIVYREREQKDNLMKEILTAHEHSNREFDPIFVKGGKERRDSVSNALMNCPANCEFVYVHDCARPMIKKETIDEMGKVVSVTGAVVIARPVQDTIKEIEDFDTMHISKPYPTKSINRSKLWIMETPQVAKKEWLVQGMTIALEKKLVITDEVSALELIGKKVSLLNPEYPNPKITSHSDWPYLKFLLSSK